MQHLGHLDQSYRRPIRLGRVAVPAWSVVMLGLLVSLIGLTWLRLAPNPFFDFHPGCVFRTITGLFCPGCGGTRAVMALAHGNIAKAWSMNVFVIIVGAVGWIAAIDWMLGKPTVFSFIRSSLYDARVWAVLVISFFVARNLPWVPFSLLAPG